MKGRHESCVRLLDDPAKAIDSTSGRGAVRRDTHPPPVLSRDSGHSAGISIASNHRPGHCRDIGTCRPGLKARHNGLARTWRADHGNGRRALGYLEANAQGTNGRTVGCSTPTRRTRRKESAGMVRHSLANVPPANVSVDYAHEMGISKPAGETKTETIVVQAEI
jgi:hypothetical protein